MINLKIRNKTKFFREFDRTHNEVSDPTTFRFAQQKMEGFETRLYYEYEYTKKQRGFTCFLTLTYNDQALPRQLGVPCFDYEHIRYFTNGPFYKEIMSKGWKFKYFISCELGEGKGKRVDGNPHYHVLLFFTPQSLHPSHLDSTMVEHLVKLRWQGFDENCHFARFESSRFGIVRAGKFGADVNSFRALQYCAKYVTKSRAMRELEAKYRESLEGKFEPSVDLYHQFCSEFGFDFDAPWNSKIYQFEDWFSLATAERFKRWFAHSDSKDFRDWYYTYSAECIDHEMRVFRNRYGDKCRLSNGIGEDAQNHVLWSDQRPILLVPDGKQGFKSRTLPLYIFRKKYCFVDRNNPDGYPRYVLNQLGINLKTDQFEALRCKRYNDAHLAHAVFEAAPLAFPISANVFDVPDDAYLKYADFKTVYQYRQYDPKNLLLSVDLDPFADFVRFLQPAGNEDWNPEHLVLDEQGLPLIRCDFDFHPAFAPFRDFFSAVDLVLDKIDLESDFKSKENFNEVQRLKKLYNDLHYNAPLGFCFQPPDLTDLKYDPSIN